MDVGSNPLLPSHALETDVPPLGLMGRVSLDFATAPVADQVAASVKARPNPFPKLSRQYVFLDTSRLPAMESPDARSASTNNTGEVVVVFGVVAALVFGCAVPPASIGVVSFYKSQVGCGVWGEGWSGGSRRRTCVALCALVSSSLCTFVELFVH